MFILRRPFILRVILPLACLLTIAFPFAGSASANAAAPAVPTLALTYYGSVHNTTYKKSAPLALTAIVQNGADISGDVTIGPGLCGTGHFKGTIGSDGSINFTDTPTDGCLNNAPIIFSGSRHADGSLSGTYKAPSVNQEGTWQVSPQSQSDNWAGYLVYGPPNNPVTFSDVKGSWTQPKATCSTGEDSFSYFWLGLGGAFQGVSKTLEQIGTTSICIGGKPGYFAWFELVGRSAAQGGGGLQLIAKKPLPTGCKGASLEELLARHCLLPVSPGDSIHAEVHFGSDKFMFSISNSTKWAFSTTETFTGAERNSAEWIAEAPSKKLTDFGTVHFSGCSADDSPISNGPITDKRTLISEPLIFPIKAEPSDLNSTGHGFSVVWKHH